MAATLRPQSPPGRSQLRRLARRWLLVAALSVGLICLAAAMDRTALPLGNGSPSTPVTLSALSSSLRYSSSGSGGSGADSPTTCTSDPSDTPGTWSTIDCQQAEDLHRLVEFTVPALSTIAFLLAALVALQLRSRGPDV